MSVAQLTQTPRFSETRSLRITRNMQYSHGLTVDLWISVNHSMISVIFSANSRAAPLQNAEADHRVSNITLNRLNSSLTPKNDLTKIIAFKQATICMLKALLAVDSSTNRRKSYMLTTFIFITNKKASQKKITDSISCC